MTQASFYVHPTAEVSPEAHIGAGTRIWRQAHIREFAHIGETCNIGKGVYIDTHVHIGSRVKIQNHVSIFEGVTLEDGVFIGPHVCFTNDRAPRAITPTGELKSADDWEITPTLVVWSVYWRRGGHPLWYHYWDICPRGRRVGGNRRCSTTCACFWQSCAPTWLCLPLCRASDEYSYVIGQSVGLV